MKSNLQTRLLSCLIFVFPLLSLAETITITEIMDGVNQATRRAYETQVSRVSIATCRYMIADSGLRCSEEPRNVVATSVEKFGIVDDDHTTDRSLLLVHEPPNDRGSALLVYEYSERGRDNDNWIYLPALDKVNRVVSSEGRGGSVFGSEFSVDTTENPSGRKLHEYKYKFIEETVLRGRKVWVVEIAPKPEKSKDTKYQKVVSWIDKETFLPLKEELYRDGHVHKKRTQLDIKKIDDVFVATKVLMNNVATSRVSQMDYRGVRHNVKVSDEFISQRVLTDFSFRERNLARLRDEQMKK